MIYDDVFDRCRFGFLLAIELRARARKFNCVRVFLERVNL